jgi:hypothetical protein
MDVKPEKKTWAGWLKATALGLVSTLIGGAIQDRIKPSADSLIGKVYTFAHSILVAPAPVWTLLVCLLGSAGLAFLAGRRSEDTTDPGHPGSGRGGGTVVGGGDLGGIRHRAAHAPLPEVRQRATRFAQPRPPLRQRYQDRICVRQSGLPPRRNAARHPGSSDRPRTARDPAAAKATPRRRLRARAPGDSIPLRGRLPRPALRLVPVRALAFRADARFLPEAGEPLVPAPAPAPQQWHPPDRLLFFLLRLRHKGLPREFSTRSISLDS